MADRGRPISLNLRERIKALRKEGLTVRQIAYRLMVDKATVVKYLRGPAACAV